MYYSTHLIIKTSVRISEVDSLRESFDWARNKCLFSGLTGVHVKQVALIEKFSCFPRNKEN